MASSIVCSPHSLIMIEVVTEDGEKSIKKRRCQPQQTRTTSVAIGLESSHSRFCLLPNDVLESISAFVPTRFFELNRSCYHIAAKSSFPFEYMSHLEKGNLLKTESFLQSIRAIKEKHRFLPLNYLALYHLVNQLYANACQFPWGNSFWGMKRIISCNEYVTIAKQIKREKNQNLIKIAPSIFSQIPTLLGSFDSLKEQVKGRNGKSVFAKKIREKFNKLSDAQKQSIKTIVCNDRGLTAIPNEIFLFTHLESLQLDGNKIVHVSRRIYSLTKLVSFSSMNNNIKTLPDLTRMNSLRSCKVDRLNYWHR